MNAHTILIYLSLIHGGDWDKIYEDIVQRKTDYPEEVVNEAVSKLRCKAVTIKDPEYPQYLSNTFKPPFVLFYYGDLSLINDDNNCLGVVGARKNTPYGEEITAKLVSDLAKDYTIISGMAEGIDSIAHWASINNGGKTVAVLGTAIDQCYPTSNKDLYQIIKKDHLLMSEIPPGAHTSAERFPFRNRLIVAFSKAILVTEAKYRSGTSITVNYAFQKGIDVMCVPHPAGTDSLCNLLIYQGAEMVETAGDIRLELIGERKKNYFFHP